MDLVDFVVNIGLINKRGSVERIGNCWFERRVDVLMVLYDAVLPINAVIMQLVFARIACLPN